MDQRSRDADSDEVAALRQRVAELEQRVMAYDQQAAQLRIFYLLVDNAPDAIVVTDMTGTLIYVNKAFKTLYGHGDASIGMSIPQFFPESEHARMQQILKEVEANGIWQGVLQHLRSDGSQFTGTESTLFIRDDQGQPLAMAAIVRDISDQLRAEQERSALQEQVIRAQQAALRELSTPLIPLDAGVVVMPLVGSIDSSRAQQVIETLLAGIANQHAQAAILDITGVPVVDTQVADTLLRAAQAVKLLGAQVILTGIRPEVAQTLVGLGTNLDTIVTRGSLQSGIAYALGS